jgi:hypothetical protein
MIITSRNAKHCRLGGDGTIRTTGSIQERAVVVTETETAATLLPSRVTEDGLSEQIEPVGSPLQDSVTV